MDQGQERPRSPRRVLPEEPPSWKECKFIHNLQSEHNLPVLKHHGLECLNDDELCQLLLQNDPSLLPEICPHYNRGDGPHGSCNFKTICIKLHICQHYLLGDCRFGSNCKRLHDIFNPECYEKLEKRGMSSDLINRLPSIFRNVYDIKNGNSSPTKVKGDSLNEVSTIPNNNEKLEEICLYHIRRSCSFLDKCIREHFHLPYRWQICDGAEWKDLKDMEKIEEAYCDPQNNSAHVRGSVSEFINFQTMTCGSRKVRRLSTESSVTKPPHYILTTDWLWYWKDEYGLWLEYGKQDVDHAAATVCSSDLEKAYLAKGSPTALQFKAGKHEYEINFKDMIQKNLRYKTEREVCRRPKFISPKEVEKKKISGDQHSGEWKNIPDHWDKSVLPEVGYKLIKLLSSSEEYKKIQADFQRTMPKTAILCIQRIQNPSLWEMYQCTMTVLLVTGRKNKCTKGTQGKLWPRSSYFMGPVNSTLMLFASRTLTGGSVALMVQSMAKEATLQGMHLTLITIARVSTTSRQCFWHGC
ncbi:poly [ADP-ribose] polymerase 12-like isoform X2 [Alligator sinensis]|uniref:Poly [ADP-ribose] polymerase 12-like isoform X2 n=1 Tax=Alligator sinensis TaxID=38654 RepID=A0A3Q0G8F6_ALLSI|nr:poly [ADP-ribose] polymerase 12-like isoform X2 [Alligator sinensis]